MSVLVILLLVLFVLSLLSLFNVYKVFSDQTAYVVLAVSGMGLIFSGKKADPPGRAFARDVLGM